jgi:hypothetical protein
MPILYDIPVSLHAQEIIAERGQNRIRPDLVQRAEEIVQIGQGLWRPAAIYDWFDVSSIDGQQVHLVSRSGIERAGTLKIGPKSNLLVDAHRVLVAVGTIGPELENEVQVLQASRKSLEAYLLDNAGVVALGTVGEALRCLAQETAADLGWGVGAALSPGSLVGWPVRGQRELCSLLPLEDIDVLLNRHCVLEPHKSFSAVIGLGPGYDSVHVGSVCKYCALQDTCWRRREDPS